MRICDIKICGVTNRADASLIAKFEEIKYIGCIHFIGSKRHVSLEEAAEIFDTAKGVNSGIQRVLVLVNPTMKELERAMKQTQADIVQLSGMESEDFVNSLDLYSVWKTVHVAREDDLDKMSKYLYVSKFVLDTKKDGYFGGTGESFDIDIFNRAKNYTKNLVLAGGVNLNNLTEILCLGNPQIVDISSGVESSPRKKDLNKVETILEIIRGIEV